MRKVDLLQQELEQVSSKALIKGLPFIHAMRSFSNVVSSCFGNILGDNYIENIQRFRDAYIALEISITPKVRTPHPPRVMCKNKRNLYFNPFQAHIIFQHIQEFLEAVNLDADIPRVGKLKNIFINFEVTFRKF